jgi:adenylate kinase
MATQRDRTAWLKGGKAPCECPAPKSGRAYRLVLLGAPGVGKGTQAELLMDALGACHLSTGDVFRAAKSIPDGERSPAMTQALGYMKRGDLVPDSIVVDMVRERVQCLAAPSGFLLDGFPRTVAQAESLDEMMRSRQIKLDAVVSYELPVEEVVRRLSGRRTCAGCKAIFHVETKPSRQEGVCDNCGGKLYQREDDRPESIRVRLQAYDQSTAPLADYYQKRNLLLTVSATGSPKEIFERTLTLLKARG